MIKFSDDHLINIFSDFSLTLSMICVSYFFVYVGNNIYYPSDFWIKVIRILKAKYKATFIFVTLTFVIMFDTLRV